ncbi:hypothetical protein MKX01_004768 [Papaver californicum]|nr:hypothetical protein MKX01_004768 [Papaver californicum]
MSYRLQSITTFNPITSRNITSFSKVGLLPFPIKTRVWSCKSSYRTGVEMEKPTSFKAFDVVINEPVSLNKKKAAIRNAGPAKLQQENPEFDVKREELFRYYHPLEFSPTLSIEEKTKLMEEWWEKTHSLLIEGGVTYDAIKKSVASANNIAFREGVVELFQFLEEKGVPVLIFSAGLADIIEEVLRQKLHRSFKNVKVVANRMVFDQGGRLTSFKGKTIHVMNKNEHALDMAEPIHDHLGDTDGPPEDTAAVKKRTNVLLLGDHIGDLRMSDGLNYDNRVSVGFLNDNIEISLDSYKKAYDVLYLNDASMLGVVELATQLCSSEGS